MLLWLTVLVSILISSFSPVSCARVTSGELFRYTFREGAFNSSATQSFDETGRNLLGPLNLNTDSAQWVNGINGVYLPGTGLQDRIVSSNTNGPVIAAINASGLFSAELWMRPARSNQDVIIAGFGNWTTGGRENSCMTEGRSLAIRQMGINLGYDYLGKSACLPASIDTLSDGTGFPLLHFVVSLNSIQTNIYLNGELIDWITDGAYRDFSRWVEKKLFIGQSKNLTSGSPYQGSFNGHIYLFSMYDCTLSASDVMSNYLAGPPNNLPKIFPIQFELIVRTVSLSSFNLSVSGSDADAGDTFSMFITSIPAVGSLYTNTPSLQLLSANLLPYPISSLVQLSYESGVFGDKIASFHYAAHDGKEFGIPGTVTISVIAVPAPTNQTITVYTELLAPLQLSALVPGDSSNRLDSIRIDQLPQYGTLYQTPDGVTIGSAITTVGSLVTNTQFKLLYRSFLPPLNTSGSVLVFPEQIRFSVSVGAFKSQFPGVVRINVYNKFNTSSSSFAVSVYPNERKAIVLDFTNQLTEPEHIRLIHIPTGGHLYPSLTSTTPIALLTVTAIVNRTVYYFSTSLHFPVSYSDSFTWAVTDTRGFRSPVSSNSFSVEVKDASALRMCYTSQLYSDRVPFYRRSVENLQVLYTFEEGMRDAATAVSVNRACQQGVLGNMTMNPSSAQMFHSESGLTLFSSSLSSRPTSTLSSSSFSSLFSGSITVEFVFTPSSSRQKAIVFGLGAWDVTPASPPNECETFSFAMFQDGLLFTFIRQLADGSCEYMFAALNKITDLHQKHHMVFTANKDSIAWYREGELVSTVPLSNTSSPAVIHPNHRLVISPTRDEVNPAITWQGEMYMIAIYNESLSAEKVLLNYQAKLPLQYSTPSPATQSITVIEDILNTINVIFSYNAPSYVDAVKFYITSVPEKGILQCLGVRLNSSLVPFQIDPSHPCKYQSSLNQWGANYTSFKWSAVDGSGIFRDASVTLHVLHTIVPPLALNQTSSVISQQETIITLPGRDLDEDLPLNSNMTEVLITRLPLYGALYLLNSRDQPLGNALSPASLPILSTQSIRVLYQSYPGQQGDSIQYKVKTKGLWSLNEGKTSIVVLNNLWSSASSVLLYSDGITDISSSIQGGNKLIGKDFFLLITRLPTRGELIDSQTDLVLPVGLAVGGNLLYRSFQSRYSGIYDASKSPLPDSFQFNIVERVGAEAGIVTQNIAFAPVPQAPTLALNTQYNQSSVSAHVTGSLLKNPFTIGERTGGTGQRMKITINAQPSTGVIFSFIQLNTTESLSASSTASASSSSLPSSVDYFNGSSVSLSGNLSSLLSSLDMFQWKSTSSGNYTLQLSVQNKDYPLIELSASRSYKILSPPPPSTPPKTPKLQEEERTSDAFGILPFNALYLWLALGGLVFIVVAGISIRRYRRMKKVRAEQTAKKEEEKKSAAVAAAAEEKEKKEKRSASLNITRMSAAKADDLVWSHAEQGISPHQISLSYPVSEESYGPLSIISQAQTQRGSNLPLQDLGMTSSVSYLPSTMGSTSLYHPSDVGLGRSGGVRVVRRVLGASARPYGLERTIVREQLNQSAPTITQQEYVI